MGEGELAQRAATGVTVHDKTQVYDSPILFTGADGVTRLIDLQGTVLHDWKMPGVPPRVLDPALNDGQKGRIFLQLSRSEDGRGGIYANGTVGVLDWHGTMLWEWGKNAPGGGAAAARQNHDWEQLANGNFLLLRTEERVVPVLGPAKIGDQGLSEVDRAGNVVWRWSSGDHVHQLGLSDQGMTLLRKAATNDPENPWGCLEMNSAETLGPNIWHGRNPAFHPDNIMVSFRKANVVAIVEKNSGDIVWRLGPYFDEMSGQQHQRVCRFNVPRPLDQISGQHNSHLIPKHLPGGGNILLFDCQGGAGYPPSSLGIYAGSRVLEIDPMTKQIVWQYTAESSGQPPWAFFSSFVSNAQRLPNGNTLITEGMRGRIFQVTPVGGIAWEYVSPYTGHGVAGEPEVTEPRVPDVDRLSLTSLVYRSYAVPRDWLPEDLTLQNQL